MIKGLVSDSKFLQVVHAMVDIRVHLGKEVARNFGIVLFQVQETVPQEV